MDLADLIFSAFVHPVFFVLILVLSFFLIKSILRGGRRLSVIYDTVDRHIEAMAAQNEKEAWEGLSFDLKNILLDQRRERRGKNYVGQARLKDFMSRIAPLYQREALIVDSLHEVYRVQRPRRMFMVRLRSSRTGFLRLTIWVSYVPFRGDGWSIVEVCAHPANGDINRGETLTGSKMRPSRLRRKIQKKRSGGSSESQALAKAS